MRQWWMLAAGLGALAIAGCENAMGPEGNASAADRQEILAAIDASQFSGEAIDVDGFAENFQAVALGNALYPASASPEVEVTLPRLWGRRFDAGATRTRTVDVSNDTATVSLSAQVDGRLLALFPKDGAPPDTLNRPFRHTVSQQVVLVKADSGGRRGWHILQVSPQQWVMTDPAKRTIALTRVTVTVNDQVKIDVTDAGARFDVNTKLPRLNRGDVVTVKATLTNTAATGNVPPEFVFLHVLHADPQGLGWRRLQMEKQADGSYQRSWAVRMAGRDRLVVDAIDSQTFTPAAGEYRANVWAVPYRIEQ